MDHAAAVALQPDASQAIDLDLTDIISRGDEVNWTNEEEIMLKIGVKLAAKMCICTVCKKPDTCCMFK